MKCKSTCQCCTLSSLGRAIAIFWHSFLSPVAGFSWGNKCWALRNIYLCSGETTRVFISQWNRQQNKGGQATELMPANLCWIQTTRQRKREGMAAVCVSSNGQFLKHRCSWLLPLLCPPVDETPKIQNHHTSSFVGLNPRVHSVLQTIKWPQCHKIRKDK